MTQSTIHFFSVCLFASFMLPTFSYPTFVHSDAHLNGYQGLQDHGISALVSNDHHGGVSIVGAGGSAPKGATIDLTKHGAGAGHSGLFGGSFISAGSHGKSGGYFQGASAEHGHSGLASYASPLSSYDVGAQEDTGEISPVLYSSYKEEQVSLHGAASGGLDAPGHPDAFSFDNAHEFSDFGH